MKIDRIRYFTYLSDERDPDEHDQWYGEVEKAHPEDERSYQVLWSGNQT